MGEQSSAIRGLAHISSLTLAILLTLMMTSISAWGQTFRVLHTFTGSPDGVRPTSLLEVNGSLYGTTSTGGRYGFGTIFKLSSQGTESVLYSFTGGKDGANPTALARDSKGNVYGVAQGGGNSSCHTSGGFTGCGVIFKVSSNKLTVLHTFSGGTDGALPQQVVVGPSGDLYGVAEFGGDLGCGIGQGYGCGVVFELNMSGTETVLYTFSNPDPTGGDLPVGLIMDSAGNLFGATYFGGSFSLCMYGCGALFEITRSGTAVPFYRFTGGVDGAYPNGNLLVDPKGNLYGTAFEGGDSSCVIPESLSAGCGVVFKVSSAGVETVLHTFTGPDGEGPGAGLVASKGKVYGETTGGGTDSFGVLFDLSTGGEEVLYNFKGSTDGQAPNGSLLIDSKGNLYGIAYAGGDLSCNPPYGCGTLFRLTP